MGLKNFKIWGIFMVAVVVIAFMLFQQSRRNRLELQDQAIRNIELIKGNFEVGYQSLISQSLQNEKRSIIKNEIEKNGRKPDPNSNQDIIFKNVKVDNSRLNSDDKTKPFLEIEINGKLKNITFDNLLSKINKQKFYETIFLTDTSGSVIYPYDEIGKSFANLKNKKSDFFEVPIYKDQIIYNDEDYLAYSTPVVIGNLDFYLTAIIKTSYFESIGRKVDFTNLTILVFLLGLMFFSTPIISFFGFMEGDKLTRFGVFSIGLSLIGIMVMIGFGFSFFKNHHPIPDSDHDNAIISIKNDLSQKVESKVKILQQWDTLWQENKYNELIKINPEGGVDKIFDKGTPDTISTLITSLRHREYYYNFKNDSKRELKNDSKRDTLFDASPSKQLYIGSHYSIESAVLESVISELQPSQKEVRAITFELKGSEIRHGYNDTREFILFKDDGLIIYKSQRIKAVADSISQLLSSVKWNEVNGIINENKGDTSNFKWEIPLYLDGHAFLGTLTKLQPKTEFDQSLWFLYLKDEHLEHVYSSLVTYETFAFILLYLLFLSFISFSNKINRFSTENQQLENFAYNYIFPKQSKLENFKFLIKFSVFSLFVILYYYHLTWVSFFGMFLILVINTFHYRIVMFILLGPVWVEITDARRTFSYRLEMTISANRQIILFYFFMGVILILTFVKLFFFLNTWHYYFLLFWVIGSTVFVSLKRKKLEALQHKADRRLNTELDRSKEEIENKAHQKEIALKHKRLTIDFHYLFTNFFVMWIFMIGFIPGYIIYSKIHGYESNFWERNIKPNDFTKPDGFWQEYDEIRRNFFGNITGQTDPLVTSFIYPNRSHIKPIIKNHILDPQFTENYGKRIPKSPWKIFGVVLIFFVIVSGLVWLVMALIYKIYLLDFSYFQDDKPKADQKLKESMQSLFLVGIDSDINLKWVEENLTDDPGLIEMTDCASNPTLLWGERNTPDLTAKKIWLIQNIHCLPDQKLLVEKLPHMISFAHLNGVRLILTSGISWREHFRSFSQRFDQINYSELFSSFHFEYIPITIPPDLIADSFGEEETNILIRSRKAYFYNIWSELSFEEKKVCYYYCEEGFFNYSNKPTILELLQKGVLSRKKDELPKLFDRNFRQFLLINITEEEKSLFKADQKKRGNVNSIQIAVVSFILISIAMISYFDKTFLDQATTFVAGIVGALGSLYSLFSKGIAGLKGKTES
ncbi:hypothetical protein [Cognataquiflexum rubidum]|uniref:hypothetical protein n=1 Tax=Cognataquiflexum rubidum TaxID=2922273 RepID=UPI001F13B7C6|nr:hypothetical protein [Cognataquiflexum rubidum]MCH6236128.1 hypothetical protein [Cognataquiflexum rubidum]